MSLIDEVRGLEERFRGLEERVVGRLRELAPLAAEFDELKALAARLGIEIPSLDRPAARAAASATARGDNPAAPSPRTSPARKPRAKRASGKKAATEKGTGAQATGRRRGAAADAEAPREQEIRAIVEAQPGITVAGIAKELGVEPMSLYRIVRKLTDEGALLKRGRQLHPSQ